MEELETLQCTYKADTPIHACIIWMHGLGADGHDFEGIVQELQLPGIRFILPHAPHMPVTVNNGYEMRAWYDIYGLGVDSAQDEAGIRKSQQQIEGLIDQQIALGIAPERILLAGFSQGGAIALHTALRYTTRLAGVLALSTYLPLRSALVAEMQAVNQHLPILMAHGSFDNVIALNVATLSADVLVENGYAVEWHEYAMAHSLCSQEIDDIRQFIKRLWPDEIEASL